MTEHPPTSIASRTGRTALVLSGGGVRGAYEVGVVSGIVDALALEPRDEPPFRIFVGTSVGAINASYLASAAGRGDLGISGLVELWKSLRLAVHVRVPIRDWSDRWLHRARARASPLGWSLLDAAPLERLVGDGIAWSTLHERVRDGTVRALIVAALDVATGRTTMFAELGPGVIFNPSRDPRRTARRGEIGRDHVLASAAIPLLFPARRIGDAFYCDGGLRFNTPLAPAIRVGAERLVVVSLLRDERPIDLARGEYPDLAFLSGKLLDAVLADPIVHDLQVLARFNRLLEVLEASLDAAELERVQQVLVDMRGERYRRLETLVFHPSRDIGRMAGDHLRRTGGVGHGVAGWLVSRLLRRSPTLEADWASYVLFDGDFAAELVELGRADARTRAADIRAFFGSFPS